MSKSTNRVTKRQPEIRLDRMQKGGRLRRDEREFLHRAGSEGCLVNQIFVMVPTQNQHASVNWEAIFKSGGWPAIAAALMDMDISLRPEALVEFTYFLRHGWKLSRCRHEGSVPHWFIHAPQGNRPTWCRRHRNAAKQAAWRTRQREARQAAS